MGRVRAGGRKGQRVKEYVRAGDVFQVNVSQRFEVPSEGDPISIYGALRRRNPLPFGGMVSFPGFVVVSSPPERLVSLRGRRASTRPIAGTYPRGAGSGAALLLDPKERAEHAMIVDLERNDLGRSAAYGTVRVKGAYGDGDLLARGPHRLGGRRRARRGA